MDKRLHFLDGLRGWGSLSVLLLHTFILGFPISEGVTTVLRKIFLFNGVLAVWVFFIVSGFSLAIQFCRSGDREQVICTALGRHIRLAVPILLVMLGVSVCLASGLIPPAGARPPAWRTVLANGFSVLDAFQFSVVDVFLRYDEAKTPNPPTWSMRYELWGSLLVLGLLAMVDARSIRFAAYLLVGGLALWIHPIYSAFVVGIVFAEIYAGNFLGQHRGLLNRIAQYASIPLALVLSEMTFDTTKYPGTFLIAGSALTFCMVFNNHSVAFLSNSLSRFLGRLSFPLYLVHAPVFLAYSMGDVRKARRGLGLAKNGTEPVDHCREFRCRCSVRPGRHPRSSPLEAGLRWRPHGLPLSAPALAAKREGTTRLIAAAATQRVRVPSVSATSAAP